MPSIAFTRQIPIDEGYDVCVLGNVDLDACHRGEHLHSSNPKSPIWRIVKDGRYPEIPDAHCCNTIVGPGAIGFNAGHVFEVDNNVPGTISRICAGIYGKRASTCPEHAGIPRETNPTWRKPKEQT